MWLLISSLSPTPNSVVAFDAVCDFYLKWIHGNPILKGVKGELLACIRPALQQLYSMIAGKTSEQARVSNQL
jgi:hypothetical protein